MSTLFSRRQERLVAKRRRGNEQVWTNIFVTLGSLVLSFLEEESVVTFRLIGKAFATARAAWSRIKDGKALSLCCATRVESADIVTHQATMILDGCSSLRNLHLTYDPPGALLLENRSFALERLTCTFIHNGPTLTSLLSTCTSLQVLQLDCTGITDAHCQLIAELPFLTVLGMSHGERITSCGLYFLFKAKLTDLTLSYLKMGYFLPMLVSCTTLERLRLLSVDCDGDLVELLHLPNLRELDLRGTGLQPALCFDNLQKLPALEILHLADKTIPPTALRGFRFNHLQKFYLISLDPSEEANLSFEKTSDGCACEGQPDLPSDLFEILREQSPPTKSLKLCKLILEDDECYGGYVTQALTLPVGLATLQHLTCLVLCNCRITMANFAELALLLHLEELSCLGCQLDLHEDANLVPDLFWDCVTRIPALQHFTFDRSCCVLHFDYKERHIFGILTPRILDRPTVVYLEPKEDWSRE